MRDRADGAVDQVRDMGSRTVDYVQEQPLLLGAMGITVGAVIGMLVPSTRPSAASWALCAKAGGHGA